MKGRTIKILLGLLVMITMGGRLLLAQSATSGAIGGAVYDATGSVVPGAQITATNTATGQVLKGKTSASGIYRILEVTPGNYTVAVTAEGYKTFQITNVIVTVGSLNDVSPKLDVGSVDAVVEVTDTTPDMQTQSSEISTTIDQNQIENLPINGRRFSNFALLTPGVVSNSDGFGLLSFRGISYLLNNSTVDGMDDNQAYFSEQRGRTRAAYAISLAAVQEFQVNASNFSAEYGRSAGGVINTVTKSGSNNLHGQLFFYDRDNTWGAANPYTYIMKYDAPTDTYPLVRIKPKDWRKQWGFGIGGPLLHDKLFWFYSYDQQQRNFPGVGRPSDPSDTFAQADNSLPVGTTCSLTSGTLTTAPGSLTQPQVGSQSACDIAYHLNTSYTQGIAYYKQGLQIMSSFLGVVPRTGDQVINFPRVDWQATNRDRFTLQYNRVRWSSPSGLQTQASNTYGRGSFGNDFVKEDFGIFRWTHTLNNSMINEFRFQFGRDFEYETAQKPLPNEVPLSNNIFGTPADISIGYTYDLQGFDIGKPVTLNRAALPNERRLQGENILSWSHGKHVTKMGLDYNRVTDYISNLYAENGSYSFDISGDFISDYLHAVGGVGPTTNYQNAYYSYAQGAGKPNGEVATSDYNGFITDDWRITPRLTLTAGVRYEYEYIPGNPYQNPVDTTLVGDPTTNIHKLVLGASNSLHPEVGPNDVLTTYKPDDRNNIGPRIGFAYDVFGTAKTVLRGGYGIYYGRVINSNILQSYLNNGNPNNGQIYYSGIYGDASGPHPTFPNLMTASDSSKSAQTSTVAFLDKGIQNPQVHMIDLAIQQNLGWRTSLSVMYMGSLGRELTAATDVNANTANATDVIYTVTNSGKSAAAPPALPHGGKPNPLREGQQIPVKVYKTAGNTRFNNNFYQILEIRSNVNSSYHGVAVQLRHNYTHNLSFMTNYTFAHSQDYNPYIGTGYGSFVQYDPSRLDYEYGNGQLDVRQRFVFAASYSPRIHGGNHAEKLLADGWRIAPIIQWQTGLPFTPSVQGHPDSSLSSINGTGGSNRVVQLGRNNYRYPNSYTVDLRLSKSFYFDKFGEHWRVELLGEGFNLLNHQNITGISNGAYSICDAHTTDNVGACANLPSAAAYPYLVFNKNFATYSNSNSNYVYSTRQIEIGARLHF